MIRLAKHADAAAIADIYNHYIENTVISFEEAPVSADEMRKRMEAVEAAGLPWLSLELDERAMGYAYAGIWNTRAAYRHTVLSTVYLSPEITAKGWGTKLYETLIDLLRERETHAILAGIALPNPASIALHEKLGFEKVAHLKETGYKFDKWIDVGYWQRVLL